MFSDLAVSQGSPVRRWTAITSFTLQAALVGIALLYPLFHLESLPPVVRTLLPAVATFARPAQPHTDVGRSVSPTLHPLIVTTGASFPRRPTEGIVDSGLPQPPVIDGVLGDRNQEGLHSIISDYAHPLPSAPAKPRAFRQSVMMEGNLIHKVEPQYLAIAKHLHISGSVIVKAYISRDGLISRTVVESGPPLLVQAALDAVRQWRYRPYYLNHEPIEVETEITVNFVLAR